MTLRNFSLVLAAASMCLAIGCEDKKPAPAPSTSAKMQPVPPAISIPKLPRRTFVPPDRLGRQPRRSKGATGMLLSAAMAAPDLTSEQKAKLEALQSEAQDKGGRGLDRDAYHKTWLEAVKSGKVDEKAFDGHVEAIEKARQERRAEQAKRLNELHAVLTPPQRKAVADSVRERLEQLGERSKSKAGAMGPDGRPRLKVVDPPSPHRGLRLIDRGRGKPGRRGQPGFGFTRMAAGLDLTADQKKKVDELVKKVEADRPDEEARQERREAARKRVSSWLDAFEKETFDAAKLELGLERQEPGAWMKKQLGYFSEFLGILTEEQRAELAKRFEARRVRIPEAPVSDEVDELSDGLAVPVPTKPLKPAEPAEPAEKVKEGAEGAKSDKAPAK